MIDKKVLIKLLNKEELQPAFAKGNFNLKFLVTSPGCAVTIY